MVRRVAPLAILSLTVAACAALVAPTPPPVAVPAAATPPPVAMPESPIVPAPAASGEDTFVGPGEAWIAYQNDSGLLALIRPDGSGRHLLYPATGGLQLHPDWSPDGERVIFSIRGDTDVIWIGNADGTGAEPLVPCTAPCRWVDEPAWSPDGSEIAFHRMVAAEDGTGTSTIEILDLATGDTRVVATDADERSFYAPRWSPDGSQLVAEYVYRTSTAADADVISDALAVIDVDDGDLTEITKAEDRCNNPDWSWTTDRILCSKPVSETGFDGPSYLLSLAPDGTDPVPFTPTDGGRSAIHATWLPDGSGAIFIDGSGTMAVAAADGSGVTSATGERRTSGFHPRARPTTTRAP